MLVTDPEPMLFHAEPVLCNGVVVGDVRAASYGHTLGGAVGLAMVTPPGFEDGGENAVTAKYLREGEWEVDIAGTRYPIRVSLAPMYDPKMERIRG